MIKLQRYVSSLPPQTVASNGTNGFLIVDTRPTTGIRFDAAEFNILVGPGAETTAPTTLQLMEADDTNATNFATVAGFVGGTNAAGGFTLPSIATSAGSGLSVFFGVNTRGRKRFLKISVVPGTTADVCISSSLREPNNALGTGTNSTGGDVFITG